MTFHIQDLFFHYVNIYIAKEYKETALGFCMKCMTLSKHWNDLCNLKCGLFTFFLSKHKLTIVFGFSNAYRILYEIVDSLWCTVVVYFSSLFSTVVAHCVSMPLLISTCHTLRALLQHSLHFVKLCNGWSCACRAASCLDNVIFLWISLNSVKVIIFLIDLSALQSFQLPCWCKRSCRQWCKILLMFILVFGASWSNWRVPKYFRKQ